jgi:CBS-domain-containing membrane protein
VFIQWKGADPVELWNGVPPASQRALKRAGAKVHYLDAARIAEEQATEPALVTRMQGIVLLGVFLRCAPFRHNLAMDDAALFAQIEKALRHAFPRVSDRVIEENLLCVRRGYTEVLELPHAVIERAGEGDQLRFAGKRVADVMHAGVITCHPTDPLAQVVRTMRNAHISAIVVVDGSQRMAGILSTTDLTRAMASMQDRGRLPDVLPQHLMTSDVLVTWPDEPLNDAVNRMLEHHVHRLVVVPNPRERLRPVGILSMTDVAHVAA